MKKTFSLFSLVVLLSAVTAFANTDDCLTRIQDSNWPNDRHELVLSCSLNDVKVGNTEYDRLCFSISKMQYSGYKSTWLKTIRFETKGYGARSTIVTIDENGEVGEDQDFEKNGNVIKASSHNYSFSHGQKWIETTTLNLAQTSSLQFKVTDKKFFSKRISLSATYSCTRVK